MNTATALILLAYWVALGWAGYRVGKPHGRQVLGALLGFFLGLVGLGVLALINWRRPRNAQPPAMAAEPPAEPADLR